jgi:peptide/nickel transport system substrate-binding protein
MTARPYLRLIAVLLVLLAAFTPVAVMAGKSGGGGKEKAVETPAQLKAEEKLVRFTAVWPPESLDPCCGQDTSSSILYANIYDSLVFPTAEGTVEPALAESWSVTPDGLSYTFNIRKGVKFHNGDELNAEDVVFSMDRILIMGEGYAYLFEPVVDKIVQDDDYTVTITMKKPFGPFLKALVNLYILNKNEVLAHIESEGSFGELGDYGKNWLLTHDAGSGPYMVREMKLAEHCIADRFEGYWQPFDANNPDSFTLVGTNEPVTVRTLMGNRELEITDQWQSSENYKAMDEMEGVDIAYFPSGSILAIQLHNRKPPTDDVHVRRALAYAMDYESVINALYPGSTQPVGPVSVVFHGHKKDLHQYKTNIDMAMEELKKSKYYGKLDQYPIDVCWPAEWVAADKIGLLFQASAAKIGVTVNIAKRPWAKMIADISSQDTTPHANILTVSPHYGDAGSNLSRYHSSSSSTWEQTEWLKDPEIDAMITDALATVDPGEREAKYYALQEKLDELSPSIWLVDVTQRHAYQAAYLDWAPVSTGMVIPVQGYKRYMRHIKVYPERVPE